ncbi:MAG TPA: radical SAM protein [Burkholderiales bacterium]|nr:radical SAM protein [Burkholderiales bacterium]
MSVPLPAFVQIEPVGQCNLRCRMCPVAFRETERPAFMPFDTFCRVLEQFPGVRKLQLQGLGEPLLHPRFFDMVRHAAGRGIEVTSNTNLTALSRRRAEECAASGLAHLYVSVDAADAAAYAHIREGSRLERVLRNLALLAEAKARLPSAQPRLTLTAVLMRRNLGELPALLRLAHAHGCEGLQVQRLCHDFGEETLPPRYRPMRSFIDAEMLGEGDAEALERTFAEARATAAQLGVALRLPRARPRAGRAPGCDWPWTGAYIAYSGEAMPCCMVATPDRVHFGNMATEGVAAVWHNEAYGEFRERLASASPPGICRGCAVYRGVF